MIYGIQFLNKYFRHFRQFLILGIHQFRNSKIMRFVMPTKRSYAFVNRLSSSAGFTLIEAMIAVALLAIVAVGISAPYISGFQALDEQAESMLLDSRLRSKMEELVGASFGSLSSGSDPPVTINGQSFTITWTVVPADLNGDANPEPTAVRMTVSVTERPNHFLTTIRVNNEDRVGKIT